jgi:inner membrane protein
MIARTHDLAAFTALSAAAIIMPPPSVSLSTLLLALLANQLGGVAPDIDQPTAPLWRNLPEGHLFGKIFSKLSGGHRFLCHSLLGGALFALVCHFILLFLQPLMPHVQTALVWWAFVIGLASHLVMDMLTKEGVPLFLPFPIKIGFPPAKRLRITTGKAVELFVVFPGLVAINVWLYASHYAQVISFLHRISH